MKTATTTLLFLLMFSLPILAQQGQGQGNRDGSGKQGKQQNPEMRHQKIKADLDLTDEQMVKLDLLKKKQVEESKVQRALIKTLRDELHAELKKAKPSQKVINSTTQKIGNAHRDMIRGMSDHLLEVRTILTEEQYQKLLEIHAKRGENRGKEMHQQRHNKQQGKKGKGKGKKN